MQLVPMNARLFAMIIRHAGDLTTMVNNCAVLLSFFGTCQRQILRSRRVLCTIFEVFRVFVEFEVFVVVKFLKLSKFSDFFRPAGPIRIEKRICREFVARIAPIWTKI